MMKPLSALEVGNIIMLPGPREHDWLSGRLLLVLELVKSNYPGKVGTMRCWDFTGKKVYDGGNPDYEGWIRVV